MGFWKNVDIEIRNRMRVNKSSYQDEINDSINSVAKELYGKKNNAK